MKPETSIQKIGRILLLISASLLTLLWMWVGLLFLLSGEDGFMYGDYGSAWPMLRQTYPDAAAFLFLACYPC